MVGATDEVRGAGADQLMAYIGPGLSCPKCGAHISHVVDTRPSGGFVRRRRQCVCGIRYTTHETVQEEPKRLGRAHSTKAAHLAEEIGAIFESFKPA